MPDGDDVQPSSATHVLVARLSHARHRPRPRALLSGLALPFRAAWFLATRRSLWLPAIAPALIHSVLLIGAATLVLSYADAAATWIWAPPTDTPLPGALLHVLWYGLYALVVVLGLIAAYATTLLVSGVVASPFNDVLSARTEGLLHPPEAPTPADAEPFWREALRSLRSTALIVGLYLALMAPVLLLNVLPGWGSVAATALGASVSAFFLALEFTDVTLTRHGYPLREKLRLLRRHAPLTMGFGLSTSLLLWIPGLNVLCVPIAVVGGTALALALSGTGTSSRAL